MEKMQKKKMQKLLRDGFKKKIMDFFIKGPYPPRQHP